MRELAYQLVDVFTDTPFGGNQLAVFTDPGDLRAETMQSIAHELNLSETTFVLPPEDAANHFRVRIFTPAQELPFAGHPTIGTSFILHRQGMIPPGGALRLEEGVGLIEVTLAQQPGGKLMITMQQPIPQFGAVVEDRAALSALLSLTPDDLLADYPAQIVSSGNPFLFVVLKNADAIRRVHVRADLWEQQHIDAHGVFVFTTEVSQAGSTVHCRMFAPELGIVEDPATGSACGPLGAYLLRYKLVDEATARHMVAEQGFEMKRPSLIHIHMTTEAGQIKKVGVGGYTRLIGSGVLLIPENSDE